MAERKYSLAEIDQMRADVCTLLTYSPSDGCTTISGSWEDHKRREDATVEERLRTYMLNGTEPAELVEAAAAHVATMNARWDAYQARVEAATERGKHVERSEGKIPGFHGTVKDALKQWFSGAAGQD